GRASQTKFSIRRRSRPIAYPSARWPAIRRERTDNDLNVRNRLTGVGVNDTTGNFAGPLRLGERDVNIGDFRPFADLDRLRLGFAGYARVIGARMEYAARSKSERTRRLLMPDTDQITAFGQTEDAIGASVICQVHLTVQRVEPITLGLAVLIKQVEIDHLFNHRASPRIGDAPGDHATALDVDVDIFDLLPLGDIERLSPSAHIAITRRGVAWSERGDRIPSGGHAVESKSPILIGLGARRIGRIGILFHQQNSYAARRLSFQRDKAGDGGRFRFCFSGLG